MVKQLIITADDFGAATEVNEAVERAHREGILTAASLMVSAPAAADAVARAKTMPKLRVGLHLVLVDGRPTIRKCKLTHLVDENGDFRTNMARSGAAMFFTPTGRAQLAVEITAQFKAFAETGLPLDHVNAHKHFHLHPTIASMIVSIGKHFGLNGARAPLEPISVLKKIEPDTQRTGAMLLTPFAKMLQTKFRKGGLTVPDQVFGLHWSGAMTKDRLKGIVENLPDGLSEIYMHPATGPYPGSAKGYRYPEELTALTDAQTIEKIKSSGVTCGGFADFAAAQ